MKRPAIRSGSHHSVGMTSMIDVVFLLLVFFVWTSSFDAPEQDMPGGLAVTAEASSVSSKSLPPEETTDVPMEELVLRIERTGSKSARYDLGTTRFNSVASLRERLEAIADLGISPPVIVDPDGDVSMAITVATVDLVRLAGFERVHLAVSADGSGSENAGSPAERSTE
ncbi:ExbD/TolR family protein [Rhodopirellula bahusiensis]|uniref:ExbD/TolR family protein n=1 Tax=Rhodopirellula bahusiensis TaxID=2014065 RepID=UPI00326462C9